MKKLLIPALAAAAFAVSPAHADETAFNEETVAAMKGHIVIEALGRVDEGRRDHRLHDHP